jgi:hypothetical protein
MESERIAVAQIIRLLRERPKTAWDLLPPSALAQGEDIPLRDLDGALIGYARPQSADGLTRRPGV